MVFVFGVQEEMAKVSVGIYECCLNVNEQTNVSIFSIYQSSR